MHGEGRDTPSRFCRDERLRQPIARGWVLLQRVGTLGTAVLHRRRMVGLGDVHPACAATGVTERLAAGVIPLVIVVAGARAARNLHLPAILRHAGMPTESDARPFTDLGADGEMYRAADAPVVLD